VIEFLKGLARFLVFRNVFIGLCAAAMTLETKWFFSLSLRPDPLLVFIFFATFFEYNLHAVGGRFSPSKPFQSFTRLHESGIPFTIRICILVGFVGSAASFFFLSVSEMLFFLFVGAFTLAYSLPVIKRGSRYVRVREITYLKVFTVALGWSLVTVIVPLFSELSALSKWEVAMIFLRRFLFIYAITIPFEIRDMERERRFGNVSLPMIYGVKPMKQVGIVMLTAFCILCAIHEKNFAFVLGSRQAIFFPLAISALAAGWLIIQASDKKTNWYFKFWTDGTMILQFLLLLLFNDGRI